MVVDHNGSVRHKRCKRKLACTLRKSGFLVKGDEDDEFAVFRPNEQPPYYLDLIASNSKRVLAVEVNGYSSHDSRRAILHDRHRADEIRELIKDIELYSFYFWQLTPFNEETERLVLEEMGIKCEV